MSGPLGDDTDGARRLVDEALRFVEALRDGGVPGAGDGQPEGEGMPAGHLGPECRVCPVCRAVATVRALRPEAVEHLAAAAAELVRAWREVVAAAPAEPSPAPRGDSPPVERIDVTD